ncbi:MAG TPA: DNA adenine methylase [Acidimicrobiia bacterium]|nr:DNA adenine methylase [Acidimicrobiia bacterium]
MIKYLGSKRRLVPVIGALFAASGARTALDLFTGTTRVAQELKRRGAHVTAVDLARYSEVFARCYIETDGHAIDASELEAAIAVLDALPGEPGYVTETFCRASRFFQPHNGERIDAIRDAIERGYRGSPWYPILLTSLLEAADRVDSTTGVQMAYVKQWSARSHQPLRLRVPELLAGTGIAIRADASSLVAALPAFDFAYLDPPYNQHRYDANYHIWETLVAWDEPEHYGVACKRIELRDRTRRSAFNSRPAMPDALRRVVETVDAEIVVLSYNDESWVAFDELVDMCASRGHVQVLAYDSKRYVGAQIGIHNPRGERVGRPGRARNVEYLVVSGDRSLVARTVAAAPGPDAAVLASNVSVGTGR